jgi:hypothetical protein
MSHPLSDAFILAYPMALLTTGVAFVVRLFGKNRDGKIAPSDFPSFMY